MTAIALTFPPLALGADDIADPNERAVEQKIPISSDSEPEYQQDGVSSVLVPQEPAPSHSSEDEVLLSATSGSEKQLMIHRRAKFASTTRDYVLAEELYTRLLKGSVEEELKRKVLFELAEMYLKSGENSKAVALYENIIEIYPGDPDLPGIYISLGIIYREMGAFNLAILKFYNVLNVSLRVRNKYIDEYKSISQKAQLEIARTYFMAGEYDTASKFFSRLKLLNLDDATRAEVHYKQAYTLHINGDFPAVISSLQGFFDEFPESRLVPESHFLLANAYKRMNRSKDALDEVVKLLSKTNNIPVDDLDSWLYWRKKTGNHIANNFYEQGNLFDALKIYQSMAALADDPDWQWPVIYQIGQCFERLNMYPKAREAYTLITSESDIQKEDFVPTDNLKTIQDMARWRLDQLNWNNLTDDRIKHLTNSG